MLNLKYHSKLGVGIDVDWCKTAPGRKAAVKSRSEGINVPALFKKRGFDHVRIRVADNVFTDRQLLPEIEEMVKDCLEAGIEPIVAYQAGQFKSNPTALLAIEMVADWWNEVDSVFPFESELGFNLIIETTEELKKHNDILNDCYQEIADIVSCNKILIVAPNKISNPYELPWLAIPTPPGQCIAEWHFYAAGPSKTFASKKWTTGTKEEKELITDKIDFAHNWSLDTGIPTWVGAWMANNYNEEDDNPAVVFADGAPGGGDYSIEEQIVFAKFMASSLKSRRIPFAINSDTKFFDRAKNIWYPSMRPLLDTIFEA